MANEATPRPVVPSATEILGDEDLAALEMVEEVSGEIEETIARAAEAGIDLGDAPARIKATREQARRIKQAFFPGR